MMRKLCFVLALWVMGAATASAQQQCGNCTGMVAAICGNCATYYPSESSYAAQVAGWAVDFQMSSWWKSKKVSDLTREEIAARSKALDDICDWAKKLDNSIFSSAYLNWAADAKRELSSRKAELDRQDIVKALVLNGLPTPPIPK